MNDIKLLFPNLYFSYSQFMVYDQSVALPGCDWSEKHSAQGFARCESTVNFNTILDFGHAEVTIIVGPFQSNGEYERVIGVPFLVTSGTIIVDGPEEMEVERTFSLPSSNYWLVAAQRVLGEDQEKIDLFFEQVNKPVKCSRIIVADNLLNPQLPLLETAEVAG
jgi:hypothetical protein